MTTPDNDARLPRPKSGGSRERASARETARSDDEQSTSRSTSTRSPWLVVALVAVLAGGLGSLVYANRTSSSSQTTSQVVPADDGFIAQVASYDHSTDRAQRVLVGLQTKDNSLVSFGSIDLSFRPVDERTGQVASGPPTTAVASWIPVAGQKVGANQTGPRIAGSDQGVGVYKADNVTFDRPGPWQVEASMTVDGQTKRAVTTFAVGAQHQIPAPGDKAPATDNPLAGDTTGPATAIDSRATKDGSVPDPELHSLRFADAMQNGRPTLVVVSTPTYCVSKFCGPITDSISALAKTTGDRVNFVHLEVWRDFEKAQINKAAGAWIFPAGAQDAQEPWVFLIGADGTIQQRWDNVVSDAELDAAVAAPS